ncbi:periplasmic-type flagellar collar protein FlbB [Treponema sp.]|uniref:periplasmic-type flagellar collar protein FlbB n=1 Tax=Treponema sp. TaxID=166 RepID=UPI00298E3A29|nr:flagellar protein FlbB [Treponema sp.]MCR5613583.1 flagellar protein FlbB [Treponema sp.]
MAKSGSIGKTIVLLLLVIILAFGGLLWLDVLDVVHVKPLFAPVYKLLNLQPQTSQTSTNSKPLFADLDMDRLEKQRESIELLRQEVEKRAADTEIVEKKNEQIALELENREKSLEEREKTFNNEKKKYDDIQVNIAQIAANLEGMDPKKAVAIMEEMDDQLLIDVLRKVQERAEANKVSSMVPYWLSLMKAERAATINRKLSVKPLTLEDDDE